MSKKISSTIFYLTAFLFSLGIFVVYRNIFLNISAVLYDWYDYPYYVWTIFQNIEHVQAFEFSGFFTTDAFFPHEGTLLFSDLLLPQSLLGLVFSLFTNNVILTFNLVFFSTLILNIIAVLYFWKHIFKSISGFVFASFTTVFSPFLFSQTGHFQMISYWPFFFILGLLFQKSEVKHWVKIGLLLTVQFLASVYLSIFSATTISIFLLSRVIKEVGFKAKYEQSFLDFFSHMLIGIAVFAITVSPFAYKYYQVRSAYGIERGYEEYVLYAAHITDYLFTTRNNSLLSNVGPVATWNSYNQHGVGEIAGGVGVTLAALSLIGILSIKVSSTNIQVSFKTEKKSLYFLLLAVTGFFFSLGPRLSVNGSFAFLPLPYGGLLKILPILDPVRATGRWSFLFYIALSFFAAKTIHNLLKNQSNVTQAVLLLVCITLYTAEIVPIVSPGSSETYISSVQEELVTECQETQKVLFEYPINQTRPDSHVASNLSYKTKILLAQLDHNCLLVNGYAGYDPKDLGTYETELATAIKKNSTASISALLDQKNINLLKINTKETASESVQSLISSLEKNDSFTLVSTKPDVLLYTHKP